MPRRSSSVSGRQSSWPRSRLLAPLLPGPPPSMAYGPWVAATAASLPRMTRPGSDGTGCAGRVSAADRRHRALGLEERRVVDAVPGQLHRDGAPPPPGQLGVAGPGPQRAAQVVFRAGEQAVPHLPVGGEPDPVAGAAERPGEDRKSVV